MTSYCSIMISMEFWEWLTQKYVAWRGDAVGREKTVSDFAEWIGVSQSLVSKWMRRNGRIPKGQQSITKLAAKYPEVYEILGLPRPVNEIPMDQLPHAFRFSLMAAFRDLEIYLADNAIDVNSPEAEKAVIKIFEAHGFKWTTTENDE